VQMSRVRGVTIDGKMRPPGRSGHGLNYCLWLDSTPMRRRAKGMRARKHKRNGFGSKDEVCDGGFGRTKNVFSCRTSAHHPATKRRGDRRKEVGGQGRSGEGWTPIGQRRCRDPSSFQSSEGTGICQGRRKTWGVESRSRVKN